MSAKALLAQSSKFKAQREDERNLLSALSFEPSAYQILLAFSF